MTLNRYLGGLYTKYNPEFAIPNLVRDRSESFVNAMSKMGPTKVFDLLNPFKMSEDWNVVRRNLMNVDKFKKNPALMNENDLLYKRFKEAGGSTGGLSLTTIKELEKNIADLGKQLTAPAVSKAKKLNKAVEGINEMFEDSTRFSTFKLAVKNGATDDAAAYAARKSSFDPRERGTETDTLKSLYLFVNPAIQGGKNFLRSMDFRKPAGRKTFTTVMGGLAATSYALDKYNSAQDPDYRNKIPQWKLDKNLVFVTGKDEKGDLTYINVPIGYSMVPFKMAADLGVQMTKGGEEVKDLESISSRFVSSVMDSYNPTGGSIIPTQLRPIVDLYRNQDGLGRPIRPEWMETINMDDTERYYDHTAETYGGELFLGLADSLKEMGSFGVETSPENIQYLFDTYLGGPSKFANKLSTTVSKLYNNKPLDRNEFPIARRFIGKTYAEIVEKRTGEEALLDNLDKQANTDSVVAGREARIALDKIKENPNMARSIIGETLDNNPDMQESILRRIKRDIQGELKGLDTFDQRAKRLPVKQRAMYIHSEIERLPTNKERQALIKEFFQKGIATPNVIKELLQLQKN